MLRSVQYKIIYFVMLTSVHCKIQLFFHVNIKTKKKRLNVCQVDIRTVEDKKKKLSSCQTKLQYEIYM